MKRLIYSFFILGFIFLFASCESSGTQKANKSETKKNLSILTFEKTDHDFGTVIEGEKVTYTFRFSNDGENDLELTSVGTSCGCTASEYTHGAIKPGETGKIQITFNSAHRLGMQHKKVTIRANTDPEFMELNIFAQVIDKQSEN